MITNNSNLSSPQTSSFSFEQPAPKLYIQTTTQGKKAFQCLGPDCGKVFKYKSDMDRHVLTHSKEKPITCPFPSCNKSFKRPYALKEHIRLNHTETTAFPCPLGCHLKFPNRISLRFHLGKHEFIKDRALRSKEGQDIDICVPWKRVVQWERDWWNKHKPDYSKGQPPTPEKSIFELDLLSFLKENNFSGSKRIGNYDDFSCCSKEIADAFSVASLDPTEFLEDQEFFDAVYGELVKENQELHDLCDKVDTLDEGNKPEEDPEFLPTKKLKLNFALQEKPQESQNTI